MAKPEQAPKYSLIVAGEDYGTEIDAKTGR
jgi:hypothetical protein